MGTDRHKRGIDADALGTLGETEFLSACTSAGLICNRAERDRTGWDFIVEFPMDDTDLVSHDKRATPLSSHVQVKASKSKTRRFQVRLSSMERLAKEIKPAFIYFIFFNENNTPEEAYIIHIHDSILDRILRELREASRVGDPVNQKSVSMSARTHGLRIDLGGAAIRATVERLCGPDIHAYANRKKEHIDSSGYDRPRYSGTFGMKVENRAELVDIFLGLKQNIAVRDFSAVESRYGIKLPFRPRIENGTLTIKPNPFDNCRFTVRKSPRSNPIFFYGEIFVPPIPLWDKDNLKTVIKFPLFQISLMQFHWSLEFDGADLSSRFLTAAEWLDFWRLIKILVEGIGTAEFQSLRVGSSMTFTLSKYEFSPDLGGFENYIRAAECLSSILKFTNDGNTPDIKLSDFSVSGDQIMRAYTLLCGKHALKQCPLEITTDPSGVLDAVKDAIYIDYVELSQKLIAYSCKLETKLERNDCRYSLCVERSKLVKINVMEVSRKRYLAFVADAQRSASGPYTFWREPSAAQ